MLVAAFASSFTWLEAWWKHEGLLTILAMGSRVVAQVRLGLACSPFLAVLVLTEQVALVTFALSVTLVS